MKIRTMTLDELYVFIGQSEEIFNEHYEYKKYLRLHKLHPEGFLVVGKDNIILGFAIAIPEKEAPRLHMLYTVPEARRQGIAKKIMEELFRTFQDRKSMVLEVREGNNSAIQFYMGLEFEIEGVIRKYYSNGESAYRMRRILE